MGVFLIVAAVIVFLIAIDSLVTSVDYSYINIPYAGGYTYYFDFLVSVLLLMVGLNLIKYGLKIRKFVYYYVAAYMVYLFFHYMGWL